MKHRYSGFLGEPGFTGGRRKRVKGDFSKVPNSMESRFMGLVVANNHDLPGNKVRRNVSKRTSHFSLDILLIILLVVLWFVGYTMY